MIRKLALSLLAVLAFSCQANAEFIIDNFFTVDVENDAVATLVHAAGGGNIFVEASTTGGTTVSSAPGAGYSFTGASTRSPCPTLGMFLLLTICKVSPV